MHRWRCNNQLLPIDCSRYITAINIELNTSTTTRIVVIIRSVFCLSWSRIVSVFLYNRFLKNWIGYLHPIPVLKFCRMLELMWKHWSICSVFDINYYCLTIDIVLMCIPDLLIMFGHWNITTNECCELRITDAICMWLSVYLRNSSCRQREYFWTLPICSLHKVEYVDLPTTAFAPQLVHVVQYSAVPLKMSGAVILFPTHASHVVCVPKRWSTRKRPEGKEQRMITAKKI